MTLQSTTLTAPPTTLAPSLKTRASTVEFWRFAFTVLVCLYHFEIYFPKSSLLSSGSSAVEFFFILAGFFIAKSAKRTVGGRTTPVTTKEASAAAVDFVKKKLIAILPVVIIVLILGLVVYPSFAGTLGARLHNLQNTEWEVLMLVGTPFGYNNGATPIVPMWFLTALIVVGYLYTFAMNKNYDFMMFAAPVIGILFYSYFTLNSSLTLDFNIQMGFLTAGMVKAIAMMGFGISMYGLYEYLSKKKLGIIWRTVLSLFELYAIYRLFSLMFNQPISMDNFRRPIYLMIIIMLSFLNITAFSKLLNLPIWNKLAHISLPMYLAHFSLISLYLSWISKAKKDLLAAGTPATSSTYKFFQNMGGTDIANKSVAMTSKDMICFTLLVMVVATLITLYIHLITKLVIKPGIAYHKEKQERLAARTAAAVVGADDDD